MKRLLLVGAVSSHPEGAKARKELQNFLQELLGDTVEVLSTHIDAIEYTIEPGKFAAFDTRNAIDLAAMDQIFIRGPQIITSGQASYLSQYCAWNAVPLINDYSAYYSGTKIAQMIVFLEESMPFLRTAYIADTRSLTKLAEREFGFPYILKANLSSHGDSNYLVQDRQQAAKIITFEPDTDFLAQEYCPNDRDYRVLVMAESELVFERRGAVNSHLNNTSKGGKASLAHNTLPNDILMQSHRVAERLGFSIAGVDVMPHIKTGEYYFLEINAQPQLRTGALIDDKKQILQKFFGVS